ncbi:MAG: 2-amino-4-hydroxy-6-hydroxymethyldihydropteridine diphosphokinase [Ignavibacteriales bacterium]|nr:2-amino-4-hydroxy-6-hydroxymethyldihydropteridine diphosphokinase [Ignavibacteriales bacterium]
MHRVLVGLGSNVGDRLGFLQRAVGELERTPGISVMSVSSIYETEPVGKKDQPRFLNAAIELGCSVSALQLYDRMKEIERVIGRIPTERWGPREIDLDLLYFDDDVRDGPTFIIPHREASNRRFVLVPLSEIAGDFVDPAKKRTVRSLLENCPDTCEVALSPFQLHSSALED